MDILFLFYIPIYLENFQSKKNKIIFKNCYSPKNSKKNLIREDSAGNGTTMVANSRCLVLLLVTFEDALTAQTPGCLRREANQSTGRLSCRLCHRLLFGMISRWKISENYVKLYSKIFM
jgi:hypothetical protein